MSSNVSGPVGPEYLGPEPKQRSTGSKKPAVVAASAVAVLAAAGLGGWGVVSLLGGGGPSPATAVPANAILYASVDLDPSASQKIEALQTLKKFPGLAKHLKIGSRDDLKRWVFKQVQQDGTCKNLDYDKDIAPWLGDRIGTAAVPNGKATMPEAAIQVSDQAAARKGVAALEKCGGADGKSGVAFAGDYLVLSDTQAHADKIAAAATRSTLQDDPQFQKWTGAVGDPGVVTMYGSAKAPALMLQMQKQSLMGRGFAGSPESSGAFPSAYDAGFNAGMRQAQKAYKDFKGMAGVVRFRDGTLEAEVAGGGVRNAPLGQASAADIQHLPSTTAAAFGVGLKHGWLKQELAALTSMFGGKADLDAMMRQAERETGLSLPGDVEKLLGDGFSVALDSSADFAAVDRNRDPSLLPVGVRIKGDAASIDGVIGKLRRVIGPQASMLKTKDGNGVVALGLNQKYVDSLAGNGTLGTDPTFTSVVPHADQSSTVFYANFDAGNGWLDHLASQLSHGDPSVTANVKPLHALGASSWVDGGISHGLFRLSTN